MRLNDKDFIKENLKDGRLRLDESVILEREGIDDNIKLSEAKSSKKNGLIVKVEAIHAGMTKNKTFYSGDNLEKSLNTWLEPYNKPVIKNHDVSEEPSGRVIDAQFRESVLKPGTQTIELTMNITDEDTITKVKDGRYLTLSIGGSTSSASCSICAKNIVEEGWCGHAKGKKYDGKEAYWIIGEMVFDEISWVNVPADENAQVISIQQSVETNSDERRNESVSDEIKNELDIVDEILVQESTGPNETQDEAANEEVVEEIEESKQDEESIEEQLNLKLNALEEKLNEVSTELQEKANQIELLVTELEATKEERDSFRNKNISLAKAIQKILAEKLVDLKIVLGEAEKEDKENLVSEYSKNTAKMLELEIDNVLDKSLQERVIARVSNPGGVLTNSKHSIDEDGNVVEGAGEEKKEFTIKDLAETFKDFITKKGRI